MTSAHGTLGVAWGANNAELLEAYLTQSDRWAPENLPAELKALRSMCLAIVEAIDAAYRELRAPRNLPRPGRGTGRT